MASKRDFAEALAEAWERAASDRERGASRQDSDYSAVERRLLHAQANVYRACATELRNEARKVTRG